MRITPKFWLFALFLFSLAPAVTWASSDLTEEHKPQKTLEQTNLSIFSKDTGEHRFRVELAKTSQEQEKGEMFRTSVPDHEGMLFVWESVRPVRMWMRNTLVPLDMVFIDERGVITSIEENTVPQSEAIISSHGPVAYTLELHAGSARKEKIFVGDIVVCPRLHLNDAVREG